MRVVFGLFVLLGFQACVSAATINFESTLDCAQASAGAGTCGSGGSGTGFATMTLDDTSKLFSWNVSWTGLSGTATAAHFHGPALPTQNAGVEVGIGVDSNPAVGSATLTDDQIADLVNGLWYINIHSSTFGGGEIRGQVNVVPLPAGIWLFGSALALMGWIRFRRV